MAGKIILRVILILVMIALLNLVYVYTTFPRDLREKSEHALLIKETQDSTNVFYFAESSNFSFQEQDSIRSSISEITNLFFPRLKIRAVNKPATHAGIFKQWLRQIKTGKVNPKAVVITLNLRSFDANWINSKLETPLQESVVLLKPFPKLVNRFLLSLNAFDNKTEQQREKITIEEWEKTPLKFPFEFKHKTVREWDRAMSNGGYLKEDGSWDQPKIELACHYIKTYAFNLDENNVRVKDFDEIVDWCERGKIPLYLNLMAENVEYADSLVGKELVFLIKNNRDFLIERYNKGNCKVIDNLESVRGIEFTDQNWTTEHYSYRGRMIIAKNLANALRDQFKMYYKEAY